jgi:hypothetical protein
MKKDADEVAYIPAGTELTTTALLRPFPEA